MSGSRTSNVEVKEAWYKRSILFDLEYWSSHEVRHVLDVMHIGKNFAKRLVSTILDEKIKLKDSMNARLDIKDSGVHNGQWVQVNEHIGNS